MTCVSSESVTARDKTWQAGPSLLKAPPMSDRPLPVESPLALAERHVRDGELRVERQRRILEEMRRDNHPRAEKMAEKLLLTLERSLETYRVHLEELRTYKGQ